MMRQQFKVVLAVFAGVLVLQDCMDLGDQPPVSSPGGVISFRSNVYPLFTQYGCNNCHSSGAYAWYGVDSATYANLVNKPATAGCTSFALVRPDSSAVSVLYLRLSGFNCGNRMPKGGNAIASGGLQTVKDWIDLGAENN